MFDCLASRCTRELVKEEADFPLLKWEMAVRGGTLCPPTNTTHLNYPQEKTDVLLGKCVCVERVKC